MTDGPLQPDEPAFPATEETLGLLASASLPADARARHLHAIRLRAAELGPAPVGAPAGRREAGTPLRQSLSGMRWRARRTAAVAGIWMGTLSLGTGVAAAASMNDLPGQPLYGLKRAVEAVQLRLPGDTADDVRRRLELADRRLAEMERLHAGGADEALLSGTLADARRLIDEAGALAAGDTVLTETVAGSTSRARLRLTELLSGGLPGEAADRAREAIGAATERAADRADERGDQGRGRGGHEPEDTDDDDAGQSGAAATVAPDERADGDSGRGRERERSGESDRQAAAPASSPGRGGAPPSEADEPDDDAAPSERGRSGDSAEGDADDPEGTADDADDPEADDAEADDAQADEDRSGRGQGGDTGASGHGPPEHARTSGDVSERGNSRNSARGGNR